MTVLNREFGLRTVRHVCDCAQQADRDTDLRLCEPQPLETHTWVAQAEVSQASTQQENLQYPTSAAHWGSE